MSFAGSDIVPPAITRVPHLGPHAPQHAGHRECKGGGEVNPGAAGGSLDDRTFLVGKCVTLADITVIRTALWLYTQVLEPSFPAGFPGTNC